MKKYYQIIKSKNFYAIANKEDIKEYKNTHFLPYKYGMKYKKYLVELINKTEELKNNVDFKTIYIF